MRLNRLVASRSTLSRRQADQAISDGRVAVNDQLALIGQEVTAADNITLDGKLLGEVKHQYLLLNKPPGVVCSRVGQGSQTIYSLLPQEYSHLQPVGRLDKDSRGLLLLTNDGELANQLTHPRFAKVKTYQVTLNKELADHHADQLHKGVQLDDGLSRLKVGGSGKRIQVQIAEGRNRQIRRTFQFLGYRVVNLQRTSFGKLSLGGLAEGAWRLVEPEELR